MEEFVWSQKYRPGTVGDCILPERIKRVFQGFVDNKTLPNMMLTGESGIGKTTVAKAMCDEIGITTLFINSSKENGIDVLRTKIANFASTISLVGEGRKVVILDEADGLTPAMQDGLRGFIETFSRYCTFILTCNHKARLIPALHSRCTVIDFTLKPAEKPTLASAMLKRLEGICNMEGVKYDKPALAKIVSQFFPDYRRIINELQRYASGGDIDAGIVPQIADNRVIADLAKGLAAKNFASVRKWVSENSDVDSIKVFRDLYESLATHLKPESVPQAILILSKYQYQSAFVNDQEINLVACMIELMVDCEYV
jgi:DNA polymerase III delta prime subunit